MEDMYDYLDEKYDGKYEYEFSNFRKDDSSAFMELTVQGYPGVFTVYSYELDNEVQFNDTLTNVIKTKEYEEALTKFAQTNIGGDGYKFIVERVNYNDNAKDNILLVGSDFYVFMDEEKYNQESFKQFMDKLQSLIKGISEDSQYTTIQSFIVKPGQLEKINRDNYTEKLKEDIFAYHEYYSLMEQPAAEAPAEEQPVEQPVTEEQPIAEEQPVEQPAEQPVE